MKKIKEFTVLHPPKQISTRDEVSFKNRIFLAGSIEMGNAEDWQSQVIYMLQDTPNTLVYNPRRDDWDSSWEQKIENDQFREQVEWELEKLEMATWIILYFSPGTISPISLLEMGIHSRGSKLLVCCPGGYQRKGNVDIVAKKYNITQFGTLEEIVNFIKRT